MTAAVMMLGSIVLRASRMVATWSILTLSLAPIGLDSSFVISIKSPFCVAPDLAYLVEHPYAVAENVDFRPFVVVPANRNFLQLKSVEVRNIEEFHIEPEPVDPHSIQKRPELVHVKCLKSALRVPERQACERPDYQVEHLPALLPPPRLMGADEGAVEGTRAESNIEFAMLDRSN